MLKQILSIALLTVLPAATSGAVDIGDWFGGYDMNHDGWHGTLSIVDTKADCAGSPWCAVAVRYRDQKGVLRSARIERMDERLQHMRLVIDFPSNPQAFDAYLFSHDPGKIAGTTSWGSRTFGFYALRQEPPRIARPMAGRLAEREAIRVRPARVAPDALAEAPLKPSATAVSIAEQRILATGEVERRLTDGVIKRIGQGGTLTIFPDGRQQQTMMSEVPPVFPPPPPPGTQQATWLTGHADQLLDIIAFLVPADPLARENYLNSEDTGFSVYQRIRKRTDVLHYLTQP